MWRGAWLLVAILFAAILLNNSELVFHSRQFEADDYAADSLQIIKAKHFRETLGQYSRYGFHHPGPAFLYVLAGGELFFSDATHLVPAPFNGQLIALYLLSAFFFGAALAIATRRLRAGRFCFVGIALLLAAWHFGAVGKFYEFIPGHPGLFCLWPPCLVVFPFLCFLVAAGSVWSGETKDLPLMTLAGCFLVHGHISMPLFVGPLSVLAYAGLIQQTRSETNARWPWRNAPRQHWMAAGLIALFLLPIVIDLATAYPNNFQQIVRHLEEGNGERKTVLQSILYFLHFGAYSAYPHRNPIPAFEDFDWSGTASFFRAHWKAYGLWLVVLGLGAVLRIKNAPAEQVAALRFRRRLWLVILAAIILSLVWGCFQEGPFFYYNSLSIFAIYYGVLLAFSFSCALWIEQRIAEGRSRFVWAGQIMLIGIVTAAFAQNARRFRGRPPDQADQARFANSIEEALRLDPVQPKFLNFDWQAGGQTTRVALYLERHGYRWMVRENWPMLFGREHIVAEEETDPEKIPGAGSSFWRVALHANSSGAAAAENNGSVFPLTNEYDLIVRPGKNDKSR